MVPLRKLKPALEESETFSRRARSLEEIVGNPKHEGSSLENLRLYASPLTVGEIAIKEVINSREYPSVLLREAVTRAKVEEPEPVRIVGLIELLVTIGCLRRN
jgi:hypothetical protein